MPEFKDWVWYESFERESEQSLGQGSAYSSVELTPKQLKKLKKKQKNKVFGFSNV